MAKRTRTASDRASASEPSAPADLRLAWLNRMRPYRERRERDVSIEIALKGIERELRTQRDSVGDIIDAWNRVAPASVRELASIAGVSASASASARRPSIPIKSTFGMRCGSGSAAVASMASGTISAGFIAAA